MHSPQCPPLTWAALVVPAPQQGEQRVVVANAVGADVGWYDTGNAIAISAIRARITLLEADGNAARAVKLYSNPASSLTVIVPWAPVHVFVDELAGLDCYVWPLTLEKLEPPPTER